MSVLLVHRPVMAGALCMMLMTFAEAEIRSENSLPQRPGATWVQQQPVQCLGNPWEEAWLAAHHGDASQYPLGDPLIIEPPEADIIKEHYRGEGITVLDVRSMTLDQLSGEPVGVCMACHCPQGYMLYLQVSDANVPRMSERGYRVVLTDEEMDNIISGERPGSGRPARLRRL